MNEEKIKILEMIQNGKITAAEALELLNALDSSFEESDRLPKPGMRFLRIRITGEKNKKVNVNIPLGLLKFTTKIASIGLKFIPDDARQEMQKKGIDLAQIDFEELLKLIDQGLVDGKLVDIDTDDSQDGHTKVEIYVD